MQIFSQEGSTGNFACQSTLRGHSEPINSVAFSPDGQFIASCSGVGYGRDNSVRVWNAETGEQLWQLNVDAGAGGVQSVSFSPSGDMVAAGCYNGKIHFMDAAAGQIKSSVKVDSDVWSVAYSPDGTKLTAGLGYPSYSVVVFDTQTNEQICSLTGHTR